MTVARRKMAEAARDLSRTLSRSETAKKLGVSPHVVKRLLAEDRTARGRVFQTSAADELPEADEWPDSPARCRCGLRLPCESCVTAEAAAIRTSPWTYPSSDE